MYLAVIIVEMALTKTLNLYMLQNILPMCSKYVSFFSSPLFCQSAFLYPGRVLHSKIAICVFYKNDSKF